MSDPNWLALLRQQGDPRAQHWAQMEAQRQADAMQGNAPPPDMPATIGRAYPLADPPLFSDEHTVKGQPMAPGQYEAMMRQQAVTDLLQRSRMSPQGRKRGMDKANEDLAMLWNRSRIDNAVMPAEYSVMGEQPGSIQNFLAKLFTGQTYGID